MKTRQFILFFAGFFIATQSPFAQTLPWTLYPLPLNSAQVQDFYFLNKDSGWVAGTDASVNRAVIMSTGNAGQNWRVQSLDIDGTFMGIHFTAHDTGYAVGVNYGSTTTPLILKTMDGGNSWLPQISPVNNGGLVDVVFTSPQVGYAVGFNSDAQKTLILRTTDGETWSKINHPEQNGTFKKVFFADDNYGWAFGFDDVNLTPYILQTKNSGINWTKLSHPAANGRFNDLYFVNSDTGWIVGKQEADALLLFTDNGGDTWTSENVPSFNNVTAINFFTPKHGFIAVQGQAGQSFTTILETENGGASWTELSDRITDGYI
ncbi:hypothetical protein JW935_22140 [candidate division KSB1 bacterium]|nr:hypothetical protein [candidate division KSB1 bacterium]